MRLNKTLILLASVILSATSSYTYGTSYQTCVIGDNIKTLRIRYAGSNMPERPIINLNGEDILEISFDELSHTNHQYSYTLLHLNADWTESGLMSTEYVDGFTTADITDYEYSLNTQQLYTHYRFELPNEDMHIKASGNYAVKIYEDGDIDNVVAYACFSVSEQTTDIKVNLRHNTDIELSGRYQQLDIDVSTEGLRLTNPREEIHVYVYQNGRQDNMVSKLVPTYIESNRLRYMNQRQLIFEGGNEYRHFDINSVYILGYGVNKVEFDREYYHAFLFEDETDPTLPYTTAPDANGQYVINAERTDYDDTEGEYMWVHFFMPKSSPWFDGSVYILGDICQNRLDATSRMEYDNEHKAYYKSLYLKQGAYDYEYVFVPKWATKGSLLRTEGSYWQTSNEYTVYVYYRSFGSRGDRLTGVYKVQ